MPKVHAKSYRHPGKSCREIHIKSTSIQTDEEQSYEWVEFDKRDICKRELGNWTQSKSPLNYVVNRRKGTFGFRLRGELETCETGEWNVFLNESKDSGRQGQSNNSWLYFLLQNHDMSRCEKHWVLWKHFPCTPDKLYNRKATPERYILAIEERWPMWEGFNKRKCVKWVEGLGGTRKHGSCGYVHACQREVTVTAGIWFPSASHESAKIRWLQLCLTRFRDFGRILWLTKTSGELRDWHRERKVLLKTWSLLKKSVELRSSLHLMDLRNVSLIVMWRSEVLRYFILMRV